MKLRLFVIVQPNSPWVPGGWHPASLGGPVVEAVHAFRSEADAWAWLVGGHPGDVQHEATMRKAWRVVELAPAKATP